MLNVVVRGRGEPLVVLPWFGVDGATCAGVLDTSLPADRSRWYVDLPGTGDSPGTDPTSEAVLEEVIDLLGTVSPAVHLIGLSYGGYLGLAVARRRPDLLRSVLHVCGGVLMNDRDLDGVHKPKETGDWLEAVPDDLREHFRLAVGNRAAAVSDEVRDMILAARSDDAYLDALRAGGYSLADESSSPPAVPVTAIVGACDGIVGVRDQQNLGSYVSVLDAGHYLPLEQPERFAALLTEWIGGSTSDA